MLGALAPSRKGTKKLLRQNGSQLVSVRYHYDAERRPRFTTVELILEQVPGRRCRRGSATKCMLGVLAHLVADAPTVRPRLEVEDTCVKQMLSA